MSDLIKLSSFLGGPKVLVGDGTTDIVLNTLGKVYVKTGRNTQLLTDLFSLLSNTDTSTASITFVDSTEEQKALEYPGDGYFIYNTLTETLYISYKNAYVPLIDASQYSSGTFVKKTGDTMSGQLELTTYKSPFIIASNKLVENLNAEYLGGYKENNYPKKIKNEQITGEWVFSGDGTSEGKWIFKDTVRCYGNLVTSGSLQSPTFISGFSGQGWRLDTATGTFTIDYLVVRKAMQVYELVINKISATNGSLWITNSSKCDSVLQPTIISTLDNISSLSSNTYYLIQYSDDNYKYYNTTNVNNNNYTYYNYVFYFLDINSLIEEQGKDLSYEELITLLNTLIAGTATNVNIKVYNIGEELNKDAVFRIYENDTESLKYLYYDYFASNSNNYWIINTDSKETPLLKVGDIVRCQKYADGNIKYYDAVIVKQLDSNIYIIQVAARVFDQYSNISYDEDSNIINCTTSTNTTQYSKTNTYYSAITGTRQSLNTESILASPSENDDLVQIGNIQDTSRQNAIYLTSTDDQGPYIDIITGLNRPDYSVAYNTVNYIKYIYNNISYYVRVIEDITDENFIGYFTLDTHNNPTSTTDTTGVKLAKSTTPLYLDTNGNLVECLKETDSNGNFIHNYTKTTQVRLGNLDEIYDPTFPANRQPNGFGLYGQNVFLTGQFYLNNGKSVVDVSYDNILLKFGTAGLTISENTSGSYIKLVADKIQIMTLVDGVEQETALFKNGLVNVDLMNVQKWVQSHGLYIYPEGVTGNINSPELDSTCYITSRGELVATSGSIGGFTINSDHLESKSVLSALSAIQDNLFLSDRGIFFYAVPIINGKTNAMNGYSAASIGPRVGSTGSLQQCLAYFKSTYQEYVDLTDTRYGIVCDITADISRNVYYPNAALKILRGNISGMALSTKAISTSTTFYSSDLPGFLSISDSVTVTLPYLGIDYDGKIIIIYINTSKQWIINVDTTTYDNCKLLVNGSEETSYSHYNQIGYGYIFIYKANQAGPTAGGYWIGMQLNRAS